MEQKVSHLQVTIKQLERKVTDKDSKAEELKKKVEASESHIRNLKIENSSLKLEMDHSRNALDKMSEESQSKSDELVDIKSELQRYITEVKRFEEMMDLKETDRLTLLQQYEELSKEVTAYESSNRSLGKISDNTAPYLTIFLSRDAGSQPDAGGEEQGR